MKRYIVELETIVMVTVTDVMAKNEEEAGELVLADFVGLTSYCGNGSCDKLVGTSDPNMSIDPSYSGEIISIMEE